MENVLLLEGTKSVSTLGLHLKHSDREHKFYNILNGQMGSQGNSEHKSLKSPILEVTTAKHRGGRWNVVFPTEDLFQGDSENGIME